MIGNSQCLMATAAFAVVGAIGTLMTTQFGQTRWAVAFARIGFLGGSGCSAVLAILLLTQSQPESSEIDLTLWNWFSFPGTSGASISFGLKATWANASLISLAGVVAFIASLTITSRWDQHPFDNLLMSISLIHAAATLFVFAPNLAQSFLAWAAISVLAAVLIRLSYEQTAPDSELGTSRDIRSSRLQSLNLANAGINHAAQVLAQSISRFKQAIHDRFWRPITQQFPSWLIEQTEVLETSGSSYQLLATAIAASAILLTWLL